MGWGGKGRATDRCIPPRPPSTHLQGTFTSQWGEPECRRCPVHAVAPDVGATSCTWCTVGRYGKPVCSGCGTTNSTTATVPAECRRCKPGEHIGVQAPVHDFCFACPAGKFTPNDTSTACLDCPAGYYQPYSTVRGGGGKDGRQRKPNSTHRRAPTCRAWDCVIHALAAAAALVGRLGAPPALLARPQMPPPVGRCASTARWGTSRTRRRRCACRARTARGTTAPCPCAPSASRAPWGGTSPLPMRQG